MSVRRYLPAVLLLVALPALAQEKLPPGRTVTKLEAKPAAVALKHPFDYTQLLLSATLDNGDVVDVTRLAKLELPPVVKATPAGLVRPVSDGSGSIKVTVADKTLAVPVAVSGQKGRYEVSFVRDVAPALSQARLQRRHLPRVAQTARTGSSCRSAGTTRSTTTGP